MALHLYELTDSYNQLQILLDSDEVDSTAIEMALQQVSGAIEEKAGNIAKFIKSLDYEADAIKQEEKRLADRRKAVENKRDRIKAYIQEQLEKAGMDKIKLPTVTIALQNNPPAVDVEDETKIPAKYYIIIPETKQLDKKMLLEDLKTGIVPGAKLKQGKHVRIR